MEILTTLLTWLFGVLSMTLPAGGFFLLLAIVITWLLGRSRLKSLKATERELRAEVEGLKGYLDTNRKIHERGERSLMESNRKLQEELEDLRSEARRLREKPERREWARLKRCEQVVRHLALTSPEDGIGMENVRHQVRQELVECSVEGEGLPPRRHSLLKLPLLGRRKHG